MVDATPWPLSPLGMIRCTLYWRLGGSQGIARVWGSQIIFVEITVLLSVTPTWELLRWA